MTKIVIKNCIPVNFTSLRKFQTTKSCHFNKRKKKKRKLVQPNQCYFFNFSKFSLYETQ